MQKKPRGEERERKNFGLIEHGLQEESTAPIGSKDLHKKAEKLQLGTVNTCRSKKQRSPHCKST